MLLKSSLHDNTHKWKCPYEFNGLKGLRRKILQEILLVGLVAPLGMARLKDVDEFDIHGLWTWVVKNEFSF